MRRLKNTENMVEARLQLGERVKKLREEQHLTQMQFGLMVGLDRSYISRIERGRSNITFDTILTISAGLDVSPSELLEGLEAFPAMRKPQLTLGSADTGSSYYAIRF